MSSMSLSLLFVSEMYVGLRDFIHALSSSVSMYGGTFIICVRQFGVLLYSPLKYSDMLHSLSVISTVSWLKSIVCVLDCLIN